MKIQSLSVVVPNRECANRCPFCVSRMVNSDTYPNRMDINDPLYDINVAEYAKRLKYAAGLGCQTAMLTGTSEPQQNKPFLIQWAMLHKSVDAPFANVEMQTTGLFLNGNKNYLRLLRNFVGVNTMALSVSAPSDSANNKILGHGLGGRGVNLVDLCSELKDYGFNIRLCYNLNSAFDETTPEDWFSLAKECDADQVTFRELYSSDKDTPQGKWISEHGLDPQRKALLGELLEECPNVGYTAYGAAIKDVQGMGVVYDADCMGKRPSGDTLKYLILRPDCRLYSSRDSTASLVC